MKRVTIMLVGLRPGLLMEPMSEAEIDSLPGGIGKPKAASVSSLGLSAREIAARKIYRDKEGYMAIPTENLLGCLNEAGTSHAFEGKKKLATQEKSMIPSLLFFEQDHFRFAGLNGEKDVEWVVDKRKGTNPQTGGANCVIRPKLVSWTLTVSFLYDEEMLAEDKLRQVWDSAGRKVGLCGHSKKGPFGRFVVLDWKSEKVSGKWFE